MDEEQCATRIIGAAIDVHRELGIGLLESAYELALGVELSSRGLRYRQQVPLEAVYRNVALGDAYRMDYVVEDLVVLEIKAVTHLAPIHTAQLLTYLRFSGKRLGILLNFHAPSMRRGVRRVLNGWGKPVSP